MTVAQQRAYEAFEKCTDGALTVQILEVSQDGSSRYRWTGEAHRAALFQQCLTRERVEATREQSTFKFDPTLGAFEPPGPAVFVQHAYFTTARPVGTVTATTMPPAASKFRVNDEVVFFLGIRKSGRTWQGKFRWLLPDGSVAIEHVRRLADGTGEGSWTWFTQALAPDQVQTSGTWVLETYFDDRLVGRYEFLVVRR